jgi:F-type H+-transporting ATPase subunit 8
MPQLIPFYFMNELLYTFSVVLVILIVLSKLILPRIVRLFVTRLALSSR